jgi:hypothetical protein
MFMRADSDDITAFTGALFFAEFSPENELRALQHELGTAGAISLDTLPLNEDWAAVAPRRF